MYEDVTYKYNDTNIYLQSEHKTTSITTKGIDWTCVVSNSIMFFLLIFSFVQVIWKKKPMSHVIIDVICVNIKLYSLLYSRKIELIPSNSEINVFNWLDTNGIYN